MLSIPEVSGVDMIFGGSKVFEFMPKMAEIPDDYPNKAKWDKVTGDWFFLGMKNAKWTPKPGVDTRRALAAVMAVLGSFAPKHEHKEAAVSFMLSEWFLDVTYEVGKRGPKKA